MKDLFSKIAYNALEYSKDYRFKNFDEKKALDIMNEYCECAANEHEDFGYFPFENKNLKGYSVMWAYLLDKRNDPREVVEVSQLSQGGIAHACIRWLRDKIYYKFNEELERGIQSGGIADSEEVPAALLNRLPYSSFFVETRGGFSESDLNERFEKIGLHETPGVGFGFFCTVSPHYQYNEQIGHLVNTGEKVMDIIACSEGENKQAMHCAVSMIIPREDDNNPMTIREAMISPVDYSVMEAEADAKTLEYRQNFAKIAPMYDLSILLQALQYILYLCAENNEIHKREKVKPKAWASKKDKFASTVRILEVSEPVERIFPGKTHNIYEPVKGEPTGQTKSPHTRRGHWAYRWVGHGDNKELKLRWVRETRIHPEQETNGAKITVKPAL